jgi:hypothetical protein
MLQFSTNVLRHSAQWTTNEEISMQITGFPAHAVLNVNEGYEVLHFVSRYMAYKGWFSEITFKKIESVLKTRIPFGITTHKDIKEWLDANFKR